MELLEGREPWIPAFSAGSLPPLRPWAPCPGGPCRRCRPAVGSCTRDLKPDNIFIARKQTEAGAEEVVKVLDFSIANAASLR